MPPPSPSRKRLLFRVAAVLLGLLPLFVAEIALRVFDLGRPTDYADPFVGFSDVHPLFVLNPETGRYEIPPSRQSHFRPESFLADKPADEFRIFVLGGSTVQGRPYAIETSFTTWLELSLNAADRSRRWEVVNCGGISYASYRLVPILQEAIARQADLVIVCTGQNEFLEDRTYGHIKSAPTLLAWPQRQVSRLRTYTLFREGVLRLTGHKANELPPDRPLLPAETDALLDWKGGIAKYHRDLEWQDDVITHFAFNLRRMADLARGGGVPLLFVMEVSNLDWAPFKPEHRAGITEAERQEYQSLLDEARRRSGQSLTEALDLLHRAAQIDDQHALVHFEMGRVYKLMDRLDEAKAALVKAKDLDVCTLRMLERMKDVFHAAAADTGTPLVDADALIAARSRGGIPGDQWLVDHVHPTLEGHQLLATELVGEMTRQGFLRPTTGWETERDRAYKEHLARLAREDPAYYTRGQLRMYAEQRWARGLADKERKASARSP
jgi:hypothetical protein